MNQDFETRIARLHAKAAAPQARPAPAPHSSDPQHTPIKKQGRVWALIAASTLSFALMLGMIALAADHFAPLLNPRVASANSEIRVTYLEKAVLDTMSEEDITRMRQDPALKGKSVMQQLLLSH